jgi:hypothetical protein
VNRHRRRYTNCDPRKHNGQSWALADFGELKQLTVEQSLGHRIFIEKIRPTPFPVVGVPRSGPGLPAPKLDGKESETSEARAQPTTASVPLPRRHPMCGSAGLFGGAHYSGSL